MIAPVPVYCFSITFFPMTPGQVAPLTPMRGDSSSSEHVVALIRRHCVPSLHWCIVPMMPECGILLMLWSYVPLTQGHGVRFMLCVWCSVDACGCSIEAWM